jgi:hypothetical protein
MGGKIWKRENAMIAHSLIVAAVFSASAAPTVDFDTEIIPVLTRAGCNAGSCHGAAAGRGGFHLSLLGGDPAADHETILYEFEGRRLNLAHPDQSLVILKPTGGLSHEGGEVLEFDGPHAKLLEKWIAEGARRLKSRHLVRLDVQPQDSVLETVGTQVPLRVTAHFDDGRSDDVTATTVFTSSDPGAIAIDPTTAVASVLRRGQHVVIARFLDRVVPIRLTLPLSDTPVNLAQEPRNNFVDDEILKSLTVLRIPVSPPADDATFLRRVRLDLTGRLPSRDEIEAFLAEGSADKRERLIDRLLKSNDFIDYWTYRFAVLFRIQPVPNDKQGAMAFHRWVREQVSADVPLDEMARTLVTAIGDSHIVGPANFSRVNVDARAQAELISQVFLGARLQCANCHNHPLDRWTQDDYHGLAAIFARLDRGQIVTVAARGAVTNLRTGEPAVPRIPGVRFLEPEADCRPEFANWLTSPDNPLFSQSMVNRLWRGMFGRGLVEPADDLRSTNPATHPVLLERLASDFVQHRYSLRHTLRILAQSATYGRSGITNPANQADDRFYSHAYRRPLDPEVLADAIADVTGIADRYGEETLGTRAIALFDPRTPAESLDILGRCSRQESCEGMTAANGLPTKLHQLNGELVNRKITAPEGRLHSHLSSDQTDEPILIDFYLRALSRTPTDAELTHWHKRLATANESERTEGLEDIVWGLLNCTEFCLNH